MKDRHEFPRKHYPESVPFVFPDWYTPERGPEYFDDNPIAENAVSRLTVEPLEQRREVGFTP